MRDDADDVRAAGGSKKPDEHYLEIPGLADAVRGAGE
jgi:hypothetical protein